MVFPFAGPSDGSIDLTTPLLPECDHRVTSQYSPLLSRHNCSYCFAAQPRASIYQFLAGCSSACNFADATIES